MELIEEAVCGSFYGLLGAYSVEKLEATIELFLPPSVNWDEIFVEFRRCALDKLPQVVTRILRGQNRAACLQSTEIEPTNCR